MNDDKYTLRCSVYVLFIKNDKVLLFRRINTGWQDGKYGIPGGHLEKNETVLHAGAREAKEESGLEVKEEDLEFVHAVHRHFVPGKSEETNQDYIDLGFLAKDWTGTPSVTSENKSDDMVWADINILRISRSE